MIEKLIEDKKRLAIRYKQAMEMAQQRSDKADKYDLTELLNAECSVSHNKAYFIALTREIKDLEELKKSVREELYNQGISIAEYKGACKRLGVDTDE